MANLTVFLLSVLIFQLVSGGDQTWTGELTTYSRLLCGERTSALSTTVRYDQFNPEFRTDCLFEITPHARNVRQLLIRFGFNMMQPMKTINSNSSASECIMDYIEIEGTRYCGYEDNQHIYLPFGRRAGVTLIQIHLVLTARPANFTMDNYPAFIMLIDQLTSGDNRLAPRGCMQYYSEDKGVITSFNYNHGLGLYPAGLNYSICVRHPSNAWALRLKFLDFNLNRYIIDTDRELQANQYCSHGDFGDYLSIPRSVVDPVAASDFSNVKHKRFCGRDIYNKTVISEDADSSDRLFRMRFRSFLNQSTTAGFHLEYEVLYERDANNLYT